jgi:hypothetical protein
LSEAKPRIQIPGFPDFPDSAALNPGYGVSCEINRQNSSHPMMGFASLNPSYNPNKQQNSIFVVPFRRNFPTSQ